MKSKSNLVSVIAIIVLLSFAPYPANSGELLNAADSSSSSWEAMWSFATETISAFVGAGVVAKIIE